MLRWAVIIVSALVGLVLLVALIGALLPSRHIATASLTLPQPADSVWAVIRDLGGYSSWWSGAQSVERLPDPQGREVWLQRDRQGNAIPLRVEQEEAPRRLVTRIADEDLPFGGTWTYEITPRPDGCTLTVTEDGVVKNPIFRFVSRLFLDEHATLESFLHDLAGRLNKPGPIPAP
jgi:uncharacterized protein YndB with AHSA1/START domain